MGGLRRGDDQVQEEERSINFNNICNYTDAISIC